MIRTPSIIGSSLVVASLVCGAVPAHAQAQDKDPATAPAAAQTPAAQPPQAQAAPAVPAAQAATPQPAPAAVPVSAPKPAAAASPAPVEKAAAPAAVNLKVTAVSSNLAQQERDASAKELEEKLAPTPGGLTADEVVQKALVNSPQLKKAELEANKAEANKARAKLSFAPRIDLMGNYTRLSNIRMLNFAAMLGGNEETDPGAPPMAPPPAYIDGNNPGPFGPYLNQWTAKASVSFPITDWFLTILPTYRGVSLMGQIADDQRKAQELQVAHEARLVFYNYVHARGGEIVALASVHVLEESVRDLEGLVQVGAATPSSLARARAARANAEAMATHMNGLVQVTLEQLSQMTGETMTRERGIGEAIIGLELGAAPSVEQIVQEAKAERPELKALRGVEQVRKHFARANRGAVLPRITAGGAYTYANPNQRYIPLSDTFKGTWDVGVTVAWSPNDAAYAATQVQDADTELRIVEQDLRGFEQAIAVESASAVSSFHAATAEIAAKSEGLEAARAYHLDQRALMLAGAAKPNDVLLAERDLTQAALEWVDAFINGRRAQANLLKAQGKTGLVSPGPKAAGSTP